MKTLHVNIPGREYDIKIGSGLLDWSGNLISEVLPCGKAAVVTDSNVAPLYADRVLDSLGAAGYETHLTVIPAGEKSKSAEMLFYLYDELLGFGMTRTDLVIALGGGVVGDLTGYAAASLMRGIPLIQIPTTLLAQVDSSVGGKVAIDLPQGKNLVGAFYQPRMVIIDPDCLRTLTPRVLADGMAEVIKYGAIKDKNLFEVLEGISNTQDLFAKIGEIIYTCCDIKRRVVEEDELDTGGRMILNFGHTFGHAIEKQFHYETYTHGEAVGIGMVMACEYGERWELTPKGTAERMRGILRRYQLPLEAPMEPEALADAVAVDKKGEGEKLNLILLRGIGDVIVEKIDKSALF